MTSRRPRARDLGIVIGDGRPGRWNAITDVPGVRVGHRSVDDGAGVHTGVTVIQPREGNVAAEPVFAGLHRLNGFGELTGSWWIEESGLLTSPIAITNTYSVGVVRDALIAYSLRQDPTSPWDLPVVGETSDSRLNDIAAMRVTPEHVNDALEQVRAGRVAEGSVGGGTGMICHGFKGGIGTASRQLDERDGGWTIGVLVQANHGVRERLRVNAVPVGAIIDRDAVPVPGSSPAARQGSIISIVATDAPLSPRQCERLAQRSALGVARTGGAGEDSSGDLFLAFATGNRGLAADDPLHQIRMLDGRRMDPMSYAAIDATEEAIINALLAAETMTGYLGNTAHALPHASLLTAMGMGHPPQERW